MFEVGKDILKGGVKSIGGDFASRGRLRFIYSVFVIIFAAFIIRTMYFGIVGTDRARRGAGDGAWEITRADIVDRHGDILAKNIMSGHITLRPNAVVDGDAVANLIHTVLPAEYTVTDALNLLNSSRRFIYIKKLATENQRNQIIAAKLPGLEVEKVQTRRYPKRRLFSHIVGFVGNENNGLEGAERVYDAYLRDNTDPLRLSLDSRIQSVFYEQLSIAMQKYGARGAMGILMDARTGEIIAIVSLPDFDPENISASDTRMFMPIRGVFEMGSIFKIFNTAMALENGLDKKYFVDAPFKVLDKFGRTAATINDVSSLKKITKAKPYMTIEEIMMNSSNAGSAQIALDLPEGAQKEFFERININRALDLEFGRTERTLMPQKWGPTEKVTVSFGHGISVTPMHLLLGVNSMVNGGIYIYPTLQKRGVGKIEGTRVISPEISASLREVMFRISEETSGKQARIAGIRIGGKTATAEKRINGKIDRRKNITAFAAAFPIDAPQYTMLVVLDEPGGTAESFGLRTAAWNAVPVAGKILDSILPLLFD